MKRYINVGMVPKSVGAGRVLMHNHVRHTVDMPCGVNGFRAWRWSWQKETLTRISK